jgi:hypothetical protein
MALAIEIEQHQPNDDFKFTLRFGVEDIDQVTTYDIAYDIACEDFISPGGAIQETFS